MAKLLDGKIIQDKIATDLKTKISAQFARPRLAIIQVGNNSESNTYIEQKIKFGEKIGANVKLVKLPEDVTEKTLKFQISTLNSEKSIHGIIVQLPIPQHLNKNEIIELIDPEKDVDGQTSTNIKRLLENDPAGYIPATTKGVSTLLDHYKIPIEGKHVVVVGRSSLVGKPTAMAMLNRNATVTVCHSKTSDLKSFTQSADILIVAAGQPKMITKEYISPKQTVIDVGINVVDQSQNNKPENEPTGRKLIGDVDFNQVDKIVSSISPVPGGVGPLTVASLFENLFQAYENQNA